MSIGEQDKIDAERRAMAHDMVAAAKLSTLDEAKRFAHAWIVTAAQHAANEKYYRERLEASADWMKSEAWLANIGHVLAGYAVILTAWSFTHTLVHMGQTWIALVIYAILKEYVFDLRYESGETVSSSTVDFVGYIGGAGLGTAVVELARAFAH